MKPGSLSHELKEALGMPEGAPPPWLINMQVGELETTCSFTGRVVTYLRFLFHYYDVFVANVIPIPPIFHAEIWSSTLLSSAEDPWTQCSYSTRSQVWLSARRLG